MSFKEELAEDLKEYIRDRDFMRATGISRRAKLEYLPGRHLDYQKDLKAAAKVFAKIHKLGTERADRLIKEEKPLTAIWNESGSLLDRYFDSELVEPEIKKFLEKMKADLEMLFPDVI